eukprot:UN12759
MKSGMYLSPTLDHRCPLRIHIPWNFQSVIHETYGSDDLQHRGRKACIIMSK